MMGVDISVTFSLSQHYSLDIWKNRFQFKLMAGYGWKYSNKKKVSTIKVNNVQYVLNLVNI